MTDNYKNKTKQQIKEEMMEKKQEIKSKAKKIEFAFKQVKKQ